MELKDLIIFVEEEEKKAKVEYGQDLNFKELGIKRVTAFKQIREILQEKLQIDKVYKEYKEPSK